MSVEKLLKDMGLGEDDIIKAIKKLETALEKGVESLKKTLNSIDFKSIGDKLNLELQDVIADAQEGAEALRKAFSSLDIKSIEKKINESTQNLVESVQKDVTLIKKAFASIDFTHIKPIIQNKLQALFGSMQSAFSGFSRMFVAFDASRFFSNMFNSFVDNTNILTKFSKSLGISAKEIQIWQNATKTIGAEGTEILETFSAMTAHLNEVAQSASGPAFEALNALGISATDAEGNVRPVTAVLRDLAKAGENLSPEEMEKYCNSLGIDESTLTLLSQGEGKLGELLATSETLSSYMEEDAKSATEASISMNTFFLSLEALSSMIMRAILPAVELMTKGITAFIVELKENEAFAIGFFSTLIILAGILAIKMIIAFAPVIATIAMVVAIGMVLTAVITGIVYCIENAETIFASFKETVIATFNEFIESASTLIDSWLASFNEFGTSLKEFFSTLWDDIVNYLVEAFNASIEAIANLFSSLFSWIWEKLTSITTSAFNSIKSFFGFGSDEEESTSASLPSPDDLSHASFSTYHRRATTNNMQSSSRIDNVNIYTQATDSQGIAKSITPAINTEFDNSFMMASDMGVIAK